MEISSIISNRQKYMTQSKLNCDGYSYNHFLPVSSEKPGNILTRVTTTPKDLIWNQLFHLRMVRNARWAIESKRVTTTPNDDSSSYGINFSTCLWHDRYAEFGEATNLFNCINEDYFQNFVNILICSDGLLATCKKKRGGALTIRPLYTSNLFWFRVGFFCSMFKKGWVRPCSKICDLFS